jgi:hypothetical protein
VFRERAAIPAPAGDKPLIASHGRKAFRP